MEDVEEEEEEEPVIDIDDGNLKDPLSVVEYVSEIYDHYRKTEVKSYLHCQKIENVFVYFQ